MTSILRSTTLASFFLLAIGPTECHRPTPAACWKDVDGRGTPECWFTYEEEMSKYRENYDPNEALLTFVWV